MTRRETSGPVPDITLERDVIGVIAIVSGCELLPDKIRLQDDLENDLGMDLFDRVELALALEEKFCISIPNDEPQKWRTVEDVVRSVDRHVNR